MQRARDIGFVTDKPVYHGSAGPEFSAFDPKKRGSMTHAPTAREAYWVAHDPDTAQFFAEMKAAKDHQDPWIMPLLYRSEKRANINLTGDEKMHEIAATLAQAWDDGFTSVQINNYSSPKGPTSILAVKNPNQLRSPSAAFDPRKKGSGKLLAGLGAGVIGAETLMPPDSDAP